MNWKEEARDGESAANYRQETVMIDKQYNSAFRRTGLHDYLQSIHARNLLLCGMQTEYCIDATCKVAFELEYTLTIPQDTTTTFGNAFADGEGLVRYYEEMIWNRRYAQVTPVQEVIENLSV